MDRKNWQLANLGELFPKSRGHFGKWRVHLHIRTLVRLPVEDVEAIAGKILPHSQAAGVGQRELKGGASVVIGMGYHLGGNGPQSSGGEHTNRSLCVHSKPIEFDH